MIKSYMAQEQKLAMKVGLESILPAYFSLLPFQVERMENPLPVKSETALYSRDER